ncbi:hypothetical protein SSAmo_1350 [Enterobacterales bacterium endosymbiont of Anomoneura mori]|uniref:pyridoxine 5'-phosphate synthase n=1 Tax=Enterobacterales bacterium endosymbiont of Anomoneura mori TaxID=3132096 RepID=UPI00399CCC7F
MILINFDINYFIHLKKKKKNFFNDLIKLIFILKQSGIDSITINLLNYYEIINIEYIKFLKKIIKINIRIKINIDDKILDIILYLKPKYCCLILNKSIKKKINEISLAVNLIKNNNINVSLLIEPNLYQVDTAVNIGIKCVEINTNTYSVSKNIYEKKYNFNKLKKTSIYSKKKDLKIILGNGINYKNIKQIIKIKQINEIIIGYSIINKSFFIGLKKALKKMKSIIKNNI